MLTIKTTLLSLVLKIHSNI